MRAIGDWWRWFIRGGWRWAILAVLIVAFLWFVPQLQGEYFSPKVPAEERPALVNEYRRTWAQIVGGSGSSSGSTSRGGGSRSPSESWKPHATSKPRNASLEQ